MSEPTTQPRKVTVAQSPRRKLLALRIVTLVLLVIVVLAVLPALIATAYTPSCNKCHTDQVNAQKEGPHAQTTCLSCHGGSTGSRKLAFRETVMYGMVLKVVPLSSQASVPNVTCVTCHSNDSFSSVDATGVVSAKGLRISHVACAKGQDCTSCHGGTGHQLKDQLPTSYTMDACVSCHTKNQQDSTTCSNCHIGNYSNAAQQASASSSSFSTTHGPNWEQMHGAGDQSTCGSCHQQSDCARCHGGLVPHDQNIVTTHGPEAAKPDAKCNTCHTDQKFCDNCHGLPMPHPSNFLETHVTETKKIGEDTCYNCHSKQDCDSCHDAHVHPGGAGL